MKLIEDRIQLVGTLRVLYWKSQRKHECGFPQLQLVVIQMNIDSINHSFLVLLSNTNIAQELFLKFYFISKLHVLLVPLLKNKCN